MSSSARFECFDLAHGPDRSVFALLYYVARERLSSTYAYWGPGGAFLTTPLVPCARQFASPAAASRALQDSGQKPDDFDMVPVRVSYEVGQPLAPDASGDPHPFAPTPSV